MLYEFLIAYLLIISLVAVVVTIVDKLSAIAQKRRVPERTLLTLSLLGGSVAMLVTMLIIRHKTRKLNSVKKSTDGSKVKTTCARAAERTHITLSW